MCYTFNDKGKSDGSPDMEAIQTCKMLADWLLQMQGVLEMEMYLEFKVWLK